MSENRLIQDDDCHWYCIPVAQEVEFREWEASIYDGLEYHGRDFHECRVQGPHTVVFGEWRERAN